MHVPPPPSLPLISTQFRFPLKPLLVSSFLPLLFALIRIFVLCSVQLCSLSSCRLFQIIMSVSPLPGLHCPSACCRSHTSLQGRRLFSFCSPHLLSSPYRPAAFIFSSHIPRLFRFIFLSVQIPISAQKTFSRGRLASNNLSQHAILFFFLSPLLFYLPLNL